MRTTVAEDNNPSVVQWPGPCVDICRHPLWRMKQWVYLLSARCPWTTWSSWVLLRVCVSGEYIVTVRRSRSSLYLVDGLLPMWREHVHPRPTLRRSRNRKNWRRCASHAWTSASFSLTSNVSLIPFLRLKHCVQLEYKVTMSTSRCWERFHSLVDNWWTASRS